MSTTTTKDIMDDCNRQEIENELIQIENAKLRAENKRLENKLQRIAEFSLSKREEV